MDNPSSISLTVIYSNGYSHDDTCTVYVTPSENYITLRDNLSYMLEVPPDQLLLSLLRCERNGSVVIINNEMTIDIYAAVREGNCHVLATRITTTAMDRTTAANMANTAGYISNNTITDFNMAIRPPATPNNPNRMTTNSLVGTRPNAPETLPIHASYGTYPGYNNSMVSHMNQIHQQQQQQRQMAIAQMSRVAAEGPTARTGVRTQPNVPMSLMNAAARSQEPQQMGRRNYGRNFQVMNFQMSDQRRSLGSVITTPTYTPPSDQATPSTNHIAPAVLQHVQQTQIDQTYAANVDGA